MRVVIKVPDTLKEIIQTFPLLHAFNKELHRRYDDEEIENYDIHFICLKNVVSVLNLLPFKAFYHEIEPEDQKNVFSMHRAIKNSLLDNVDTYISLTKSFVDASIGKNLNASVRAGFAIGKNKLFINKSIPYLEGQHASDIYFSFMKVLFEGELPAIPNVTTRNLDPFYADWNLNPYFVVNLKLNDDLTLDNQWHDFFGLFKNVNFVLLSDRLKSETHDEVLTTVIKNLPLGNFYKITNSDDLIKFAKVLAYAKCFITYNSDLLHLAGYCGTSCFWLQDKKVAPTSRPEYILSDVKEFSLAKNGDPGSSLSGVFDEIYAFIDKIVGKSENDF